MVRDYKIKKIENLNTEEPNKFKNLKKDYSIEFITKKEIYKRFKTSKLLGAIV